MKTMAMAILMAAVAAAGDEGREDAVRKLETMKVSIDFQEVKFTDGIAYLRDLAGLNFVVSPRVEDPDGRVTLKVRDVTLRSALKLMLNGRGLAATWREGAIVIVPKAELQETVTLQMYDVRGLLLKLQDFPGPGMELVSPSPSGLGPISGVAVFESLEPRDGAVNEGTLVDLIRESTGGKSWDENAKATIQLSNGILLVMQTPAVHREISRLVGLLGQYR